MILLRFLFGSEEEVGEEEEEEEEEDSSIIVNILSIASKDSRFDLFLSNLLKAYKAGSCDKKSQSIITNSSKFNFE